MCVVDNNTSNLKTEYKASLGNLILVEKNFESTQPMQDFWKRYFAAKDTTKPLLLASNAHPQIRKEINGYTAKLSNQLTELSRIKQEFTVIKHALNSEDSSSDLIFNLEIEEDQKENDGVSLQNVEEAITLTDQTYDAIQTTNRDALLLIKTIEDHLPSHNKETICELEFQQSTRISHSV